MPAAVEPTEKSPTPVTDGAASPANARRPIAPRVWGAVALLFGLLTLKEGTAVLCSEAARQEAGHFVPFVLWFNVLAAFAYVAAGPGLWASRPWATRLAMALAATNLLVFAALGVHVALGRPYELRTVAAMTLRSTFWIAASIAARRRSAG